MHLFCIQGQRAFIFCIIYIIKNLKENGVLSVVDISIVAAVVAVFFVVVFIVGVVFAVVVVGDRVG